MLNADLSARAETEKAASIIGAGGDAQHAPSGAAGDSPRLVIRGESHAAEPDAAAAFVDWLNFTFPNPATDSLEFWPLDLQLRESFGFGISTARNRGHLNYSKSWDLGQGFGVFAAGGDSVGGTCLFSLSGVGCHAVKDWAAVYRLLLKLKAKITRVDLAHDDFKGLRDVKLAITWYMGGKFNSERGRPPKAQLIDDFGLGTGKTLYVGSRESGKLLRVYEKGKQLGDPSHPWVRWELELHSKDRIIPVEVLVSPGAYLATSYPCMAWVSDEQSRIAVLTTTAEISLDLLLTHCRSSYGKLIWTLWKVLEFSPEEIVSKLARPGVPPRLNLPVVGGGDL